MNQKKLTDPFCGCSCHNFNDEHCFCYSCICDYDKLPTKPNTVLTMDG